MKIKYAQKLLPQYSARNELRKIYSNLWNELNLPQKFKPSLHFKAMDIDSKMSFCPEDYIIYVNKYTCKNLQLRNKTGKTKAVLRHEIEHVKQIWDIIRLKSAETIIEKLDIQSKKRLNFFKQIEKVLGPLPNNPKKINRVKKYYTNLLNYPNMQNQYNSILDFKIIKDLYKYYTNVLEIDAQKAERKYRPSWFKILKTYLKQILCNNN